MWLQTVLTKGVAGKLGGGVGGGGVFLEVDLYSTADTLITSHCERNL